MSAIRLTASHIFSLRNTDSIGLPGHNGDLLRRLSKVSQSAFTIPSTIFLASPNSIMVLSRKNSSFSTPA